MTAASPAAPVRNDRYDGLRGIAILFVMLLHLQLFDLGWVGVQAFFVLSGFLITDILMRAREAPLGRYLRTFYARRALRIFPLYFVYLLGLAMVYRVFGVPALFHRYWLSLFTYTHNLTHLQASWHFSPWFGHLWSLCIEEQFYLLWPLAIHAQSRPRIERCLVLMIALAPAVRALVAAYLAEQLPYPPYIGDGIYWFTLSHADAFAFGAVVTVFDLPNRIGPAAGRMLGRATLLVLAVGLINLCYLRSIGIDLAPTSLGFPLGMLANYQHLWGYTLLNAFFAFVVALAARGDAAVAFLANRALVGLGRVSYGVYVLHSAVITGYGIASQSWFAALPKDTGYLVQRLVGVPICIGGSYCLARVSYRWLEAPFLAWKERWSWAA